MTDHDYALVGALLLAISALAYGCGASSIQIHANAATVAIVTIQQAEDVVATAHEEALDGVVSSTEAMSRDVREQALRTEAARWSPISAGSLAVRAALGTWVDAIGLAQAAGSGDDLLGPLARLAARVVSLYSDVAALVNQLAPNAGFPELPESITGLLAAVGGE